MNGQEKGNIIPDEKLGKAMQVLYNVWFNKWRRLTREMTPDMWDQCLAELLHITGQGDYEVVRRIGDALAMELEALGVPYAIHDLAGNNAGELGIS